MNYNLHCWSNCQKLILQPFYKIKSWLIISKRPKLQLFQSNNNQNRPKKQKSISTPKEKFIGLLLLKVLCFTSCVFLSALSIICINIPLKVSSSSSLKPLKELKKKMKQGLTNSYKILGTLSINGFQEDCLKNINWSS